MRRNHPARGATLVEVALAVVLLVVPTSVLVVSLADASATRIRSERRHRAIEAALSVRDDVQATPIDQVWATWGPAGTEGNTFSIEELDTDGVPAGSITTVIDETTEDDDLALPFGMPRDLDADGFADNPDVSATAQALPVIVGVQWGATRPRESFLIPAVVLR